MHLGLCSRSNDVVEPMLKPQWFVNCDSLAKQALQAATDGENPKLEFIPKQFLAEWKRLSHVFAFVSHQLIEKHNINIG
jgi:valyl-tRNA synthetase